MLDCHFMPHSPLSRVLCALLALGLPGFAQTHHVSDAKVEKVHKSALLIDTHNDVTSKTVDGFDIGKPPVTAHTDLPRLRQGNVGAQFFAAWH